MSTNTTIDRETQALRGAETKLSGHDTTRAPYPEFKRDYPDTFVATESYRATLPDLQNGPSSLIRGRNCAIQHVGISNFRLPLTYQTRDGSPISLETSVTGTVSLDADKKGINMSRIMRSFYAHSEQSFGFEALTKTVEAYKQSLISFDARISLSFSFPQKMQSLRSGMSGYQYYRVGLELRDMDGQAHKLLHMDYVYSSTCPCSLELSEHARAQRNQLATPHSQRSVARISLLVDEATGPLWFEDVIDAMRRAVPTETQVMVKREDEQAFAELNAANPIFVEDAARLFSQQFSDDPRISDFRVVASHQESLHSHDAVSVLTGNGSYFSPDIEPHLFASMFHVG